MGGRIAVRCAVAAIGAALLLGWSSARATAQSVMVASPAIVIDDRTRTGTMTLLNDGLEPIEVDVSTFCGYPVTDSAGRMFLRTFDAPADTTPCAADWIQSFPRRLRIQPRSRATVRLLVTPPADAAPREYWARVMASARAGRIAVGGAPDSSGIEAGLAVEIRSVVGLFYRRGSVRTGVVLDRLRAEPLGDSLVGRARLVRQGDAAFVGSLVATLRDAAGRTVAESLLPLGVYYTLEPRFTLPLAALAPGRYELAVEAVSRRPDLASDLLLATLPVRGSVAVDIP